MCGITGGVWTASAQPIDEATLARMTLALAHRGPDASGLHREELSQGKHPAALCGVALGHRRLSIIDLTLGQQPLANEDGSVWVVFNGEIYNFHDLRNRLEGNGHVFRTASDTEVLVHLYEDEGPAMFRHLEGMFALAIWDSRKRQLVLARDRLGKKPLLYRHEPGRLTFASELKSLLQVPGAPREIDPTSLDAYLAYQYVPHPLCIFRGYAKLPPASYAVFAGDQLKVENYWQPDFRKEVARSAEEYRALLSERLTAAVRKRLVSDVPLGAFLSGGIDSSIVVGLMQRALDAPVKTFSIGFPVPEFDETSYARQVAQHLGTDHHEFVVEPQAVEILPWLVWHYDEPFADSSAIPTYYVSQYTRQQVTVALTGDGGDELFAGYQRYRAVKLGQLFDRLGPIKQLVAGEWIQRLPGNWRPRSFVRRGQRFAAALAQPLERRYFDWVSIFNDRRRALLYADDFLERLPDEDPFGFLRAAFRRAAGRDAITAASLADLVTYLPCDINHKVDIASMAHGLECRQPFLDHHVVELAIEMPCKYKYRGRKGKRILLETFGDLLPPAVQKRGKMGFGVPLAHWFRHELRELLHDTLLCDTARARGYFRPEAVEEMVTQHVSGQIDHSYRLWSLLFLELWHRQWVDQAPALAAPIAISNT